MISTLLALALIGQLAHSAAPQAPDSCEAIRQKIRALPAAGGDVVIPDGHYLCLSPIVIDKSRVRLTGQGTVQLTLGKNVNSPVLILGDINTPPRPIEDVSVSNLVIDGNRWHQKFECWGGPCDGGGTSFIRNNGITVRAVTRGRIENVTVVRARSGGVVTEKGCIDLVVDRLTSIDNEFDGFAGYETVGARLMNLELSGNRAAGISIDIRFHGNLFKNVRIEKNGDVGLFMRDSNSNIFENVTISESGSHGVFVAQDYDSATCPLENEFENLTVVRSRGFGFRLNDKCEGNKLTGTSRFLQNRDGCVSQTEGAQLAIEGKVQCEE